MSTILFFINLFIILVSFSSEAYEVNHLIRPFSNFETAATNNTCSTLKNSRLAIACNPALFANSKYKQLGAHFITKSEGKSIENTKELLFTKIQEPFLKKLFTNNSFSSFTLNSNIEFYNPQFLLSYSPYYLIADFLIINPVFPEVAMVLKKRSTLKITRGDDLSRLLKLKKVTWQVGASLSYFTEKSTNTSFPLIDLGLVPVETLVNLKKHSGIMADIGSFIELKDFLYFPQLSIQIRNLGASHHTDGSRINSHRLLELREIEETYSSVGIGENLNTRFGLFYAGLELPFIGIFQQNRQTISASGRFSLGYFNTYEGFSSYSQTAGFLVSSPNSSIGILYGHEKEIKNYNVESDHVVYLGLEVGTQ